MDYPLGPFPGAAGLWSLAVVSLLAGIVVAARCWIEYRTGDDGPDYAAAAATCLLVAGIAATTGRLL